MKNQGYQLSRMNHKIYLQKDKFYQKNKDAFTFQVNDKIEVESNKPIAQRQRKSLSRERIEQINLQVNSLHLSDP